MLSGGADELTGGRGTASVLLRAAETSWLGLREPVVDDAVCWGGGGAVIGGGMEGGGGREKDALRPCVPKSGGAIFENPCPTDPLRSRDVACAAAVCDDSGLPAS